MSATRVREYVGVKRVDKNGNVIPGTSKRGSVDNRTPSGSKSVDRLRGQLAEQKNLIHNLKNLVVYKQKEQHPQPSKSDFDQCLQNYIGSAVTTEIRTALDGLTCQYNTNINRQKQAQENLKVFKEQASKKTVDKSCGTSDDFNIILAASNGSPLRFLGELAFEIEWRILLHVFGANTTLYGVSTRQIEAKIRECSTNFLTMQPDYEKRDTLQKRYEDILQVASEVGYKRQYHPSLTEHYITRYGHFSVERMPTLQLSPGQQARGLLKDIFKLHYKNYKTDKSQKAEWEEVKVLIDTLLKLAEYDGKRLFSWAERRKFLEQQKNGKMFNNW